MFATIKNLIPEPRQADQPRNYVGKHRQADPVPPASPVPSEEPEKADTAAA
ncbi:hypothetical protein ACFQS1_28620 [Paractinoplanes rhizophilus]|jgi:hypothetical protein|uniref:Uncharacterized protein n=1 Tax=Paractinoplanes rhizophilus TaxID=1416877 RepID=A0ABW2I0X4_9ACTN